MPPAHPPRPPPRPRKPKLRRKTLAPPPLTPAERAAAEAHLATQRLASQSRLKDAWESIFERYSQDFDGVADEIDTLTGEMVVDNGHLRGLRSGIGGGGGGGEGFDWEEIVSLEAAQGEEGEEGEWIDEECLECKDRDELDDSFCRSCGGGGDGRGGIFSTPLGVSIVTPAKTPRSSPPEIVPLPPPLPKAKAADPKDWLVGDVSEWMRALIGLSPDEVVDLRERVVSSGITGGYLLERLRFDDLKEILGISSFSKRMELWNEVLKLRGVFTSGRGGGGIVDSSPCLPMPVPVVGSLEGDIDADTPTHAGRGKLLAKEGKGKKKVMVVGLVSPRMASAGASDTPKQKWGGNAEGASPGLGSLDRTPDTISTTIATATPTATPTRSIKHQGKAKKLPSPTTSIASIPRPTAKQQHPKRQESPDIITTSTPASSTTTTIKTPKQKPKSKAATSSVSAVAKTPLPPRTPASNTNPWAPPPPASDPFYSPIWNDEHPDGTPAKFPSSEMRLPLTLPLEPKLTPKPQLTPATATTKNEAKRKRRSVSTTAAATTNTTTTRPLPTSTTIRKPRPFLTPAPPKRKRSSSTASATIGWTTDAKKRQKLSGRSFLKFGGGEDELSSGGSSPAERGSLRQKKGIIVDRESVEAGVVEKVHKCCGRGFCFGCLDLEGEEDDLV